MASAADYLSITDLLIAISRMPEDRRRHQAGIWYESQKEHWVGWLLHYNSPGAYGRKVVSGRDGKYVYNHVVCPQLLYYLATASGVDARKVRLARAKAQCVGTDMGKSGAFRAQIPWETVLKAMCRRGFVSARASALEVS